jgi:hypothetical protein
MSRFAPISLLPHAALAGLLCLTSAQAAAHGPEADKCNENQGLQAAGFEATPIEAELTGIPLLPGHTELTAGTNPVESPELAGVLEFQLDGKFRFESAGGLVRGTYTEQNHTGADKRCKQYVKITMKAGCVGKVRLHKYVHPLSLDLVADYRDDLPGVIASDTASRSTGKGSVIEFHLVQPVCAGNDTKWLLLNTSIDTMMKVRGLELVAPTGEHSNLRPIHVPLH